MEETTVNAILITLMVNIQATTMVEEKETFTEVKLEQGLLDKDMDNQVIAHMGEAKVVMVANQAIVRTEEAKVAMEVKEATEEAKDMADNQATAHRAETVEAKVDMVDNQAIIHMEAAKAAMEIREVKEATEAAKEDMVDNQALAHRAETVETKVDMVDNQAIVHMEAAKAIKEVKVGT